MKKLNIVKWIIALIALTVLYFAIDVEKLITAFGNVTWPLLTIFIAISFVLVYLSALKWKFFLEARGGKVSVLRLFNLYILGYFINLLMPSFIGGDAVRSWYAGQGKDVGQHQALAATILERYTGFLAMLLLALCFMWRVDAVTTNIKIVIVVLFLLVASFTYVSLSPYWVKLSERYLSRFPKIGKHLTKIQEAFRYAYGSPKLMFKAMLVSFAFHVFTVLNVAVGGYCIGWTNIPFMDLFVVLPIILLIGAIPITPNGLGLQEGAYFFFLQQLGATPDQAVALSLALRAKAYLLAVIGAGIWFGLKKEGH